MKFQVGDRVGIIGTSWLREHGTIIHIKNDTKETYPFKVRFDLDDRDDKNTTLFNEHELELLP